MQKSKSKVKREEKKLKVENLKEIIKRKLCKVDDDSEVVGRW